MTKITKDMTKDELLKAHAALEERANIMAAELAKRRESADLRAHDEKFDAQSSVQFGAFAQQFLGGLDLKPVFAKMAIGFAYGYTLGICANVVIAAFALLAMPAWVNFVVSVLVIICTAFLVMGTATAVTNFTYNSVASLFGFAKREYHAATEWAKQAAHNFKTEQEARVAKATAPAAAH